MVFLMKIGIIIFFEYINLFRLFCELHEETSFTVNDSMK